MFTLKDVILFSKLNEKQLMDLQADMLVHHYTKNSIVFYEGDESEYLQILIEGSVRLYKTNHKGIHVHMHNFEAPEVIALFAAFEEIPYPATCEFLTDGAVGLISMHKIQTYLENVTFSRSIISALSRRMRLIADLFHKETIYSSEAKIADLIYSNASVFERLKNTEIAAILNIAPETLSRILTKLKKENIITITHHVVEIHNKIALEEIIETNSIKK